MADDIRSDIIINVDTSVGIAEIKNLQRQISQLNAQLLKSGAQQAASAQNIQRNLINNINATGQFAASVKNISTTAESFTTALERNKLGMGEYFRYAGASTKTFGRLFRSEFDTIEKVARERVKTLQTQYVKLGRDGSGAMKAIAVRPLALDMENLATKTAIAAQKQQLFNQLIKQGSTNLLNFGKNTQWAGRQLMVGFTIPLAIFGSMAVKEFEKIEKQAIRFKRVYGDAFDSEGATDKALDEMKRLADGFTKYGVEVNKTLELAADAAQMGLKGAALRAQVTEATRLAVLGEVDQQEALRATIAVTDAFGVAAEDLAGKIDFLNSVENETITAINDLTIAIPKAGPVVKQLGGDVEDLAFFLTAMKEGGINASEGANALKSGLAALINPTGKAAEMLDALGINIQGIVEANKGDVKGIVVGFAQALDTLDPLNRARAIEQLFGKFQFSRLSTLFQNVIKEGSQAQKVLKLTQATSEELAIVSERELKRVESSPLFKFQSQLEKFQAALAPVGEEFLKAITPVLKFASEILKNFNNLSDGAKQFAVVATTLIAGIGPVFLMMFGLIANGAANIIKLFANMMGMFSKTGSSSRALGLSTDYMTQQQLEASAVASSLNQSHSRLIQTFSVEAAAVDRLAASYGRAIVQQSRFLGRDPRTGGPAPKKYARGVLSVPGPKGAGDVVPAMLSPGEAVIPAKQASKYRGLVSSMISDNIPGYRFGLNPFASMLGRSNVAVRMKSDDFRSALASQGKDAKYQSAFATGTGADYINASGSKTTRQRELRSAMERDVFGLDPKSAPISARPTYGYAKTPILSSLINKIFGLRGRNFNSVAKNPGDSLDKYGNIDIITKGSVAKRSSAYPGDALVNYNWATQAGTRSNYPDLNRVISNTGINPAPMRGASADQLQSFERRLGSPFGNNRVPGTTSQYTTNPKPAYVETYTPGGFSFREIDRIITSDPVIARQLKQDLKAAGLGGVHVVGSGFVSRLFKAMGVPGYSDGIDSIPAETIAEYDRFRTVRLRRLRIATRGSSSGFTKAFGEIDTHSGFADEFSAFEEAYRASAAEVRLNPEKRDSRISSYNTSEIAHIAKDTNANTGIFDVDGSEVEIKNYVARNLVKDHRSINQILEHISSSGVPGDTSRGGLLRSLDPEEIFRMAKAEMRGLSRSKFNDAFALVRSGGHPVTPESSAVLMAVAEKYGQAKGATSDSAWPRARGLQALLRFRLRDRSFFRAFDAGLLQTPLELDQELDSDAARNRSRNIATVTERLAAKRAQLGIPDNYDREMSSRLLNSRESSIPETPASAPARRPRSQRPRQAEARQAEEFKISELQGAKDMAPPTQKPKTTPMQAFAQRMMGMIGRRFRRNEYASGVVSVPGPKGAGDVVPAMLSPGEAVIPTKMAKKYGPLINSMISDSIPGYDDGFIDDTFGDGKINYNADSIRPGGFKRGTPESDKWIADNLKPAASDKLAPPQAPQAPEATETTPKKRKPITVAIEEKSQKNLANLNAKADERSAKANASLNRGMDKLENSKIGSRVDRIAQPMMNWFHARQQEATDKKLGITRGPRGGAIDAETKKPIRPGDVAKRIASNSSGMDPKQKFAQGAQRLGMIGMGTSMAVGAATMLPGEPGKIAQDMAPLLLGMSVLSMFIQGPVSAALVALVAAVALPMYAAWKLEEAFKAAQKSALDLTQSLGAGDQAIQKFAQFAGNVTASEIMDKRREGAISQFQTATGKTTFGEAFVQTEEGQSAISNVTKSLSASGRASTQQQLVNQMSTAVASGAMSAGEARSVVANIAKELGDYALGIQVNAELISILGPNGENLATDPLKVRLEILESQKEQVDLSLDAVNAAQAAGNEIGVGMMLGMGAAGAGVGAIIGAKIGAGIGTVLAPITAGISIPLVTAAGAVAGTLVGGVSGAVTGYNVGSAEYKENIGIASGASVAIQQMAIEQQQQMSDSLELEYEKRIAIAKAGGEDVKDLEEELAAGRVEILKKNKELNTDIREGFKGANTEVQTALMAGAKTAVETRYKGTQMESVAALGMKQIETSGLDLDQKYLLTMQVSSGEVDPMQLINILAMKDQTAKTQMINIIGNYGGAFGNQVSRLTQFFTDAAGKPVDRVVTDFVAKIDAADSPKEAKEILDFYNKVTQASGDQAAFTVDFLLKSDSAAKKLRDLYKEIDEIDGPITIPIVTEILGKENLNLDLADMKEFEDLTDDGQEIFLRKYATLQTTVTTAQDPKVKLWLTEPPPYGGSEFQDASPPVQLREYWEALSFQAAETGLDESTAPPLDTETDPPPGGGAKEDPLEEPLKRLKEVRAAAVNATGGVTELSKWLGGNKNMKQFQGLEQRLMGRGANRTFIDYILGLDKDVQQRFVTFKDGVLKIKAAGKNLAKMFNEIALGEYQISLKEASREAENQSKAFNKLVGAGMSVSEALAAIEDPATAAAIASKSISSEELKKLGKDANDAAAKVGLVAARLQLVEEIQQAAGEIAMRKAFDTNSTKLTELQQAAIEFDSSLSEIYQKFLTGMIKELPAEFATRMQQVIDDIEFKQSIFDDGFGKAMEAFSAQEEKLQIDMEINLKNFSLAGVTQKGAREIMTEAQNEIAALQFKMDDLNAGIQEIEWQEDEVNKKYDKRLEALDKIEKTNEAISAQQKTQISLADALTQGDIAAAARAAQEMRSQSAQGAIGNQRDVLEAARQGALGNLRSSGGKTRDQIGSDILSIQKQIFRIEEQRLEPAAEAVRLAEAKLAKDIASLTVLGKTSFEWTQVKNGIDLATTSSKPFLDAMQAALDIVKSIVSHWNTLGTKKLAVTNPLDPYGILNNSGTASANRQYFENTVLPAIASGTASASQATDYANAVNQALGRPQGTAVAMSKGGSVKYMPMGGLVPYMNMGGSVRMPKREPAPAQRLSNGGSIFQPKGTDTVPAMLTPGEFVIRKYAVEKYGIDKMKAINSGTHSSDSVYNYEVNVNVKTDANADQIARSVIGQIKQIDSQRIRGNKF